MYCVSGRCEPIPCLCFASREARMCMQICMTAAALLLALAHLVEA